jgi:hypothetical protein
LLVVRTAYLKPKERIEGMPPSRYLVEYFGIVLPDRIADLWDKAAYVEENGTIVFEGVDGEIVGGYWEVGAEPLFYDELEKFLSRYLFDSDPGFGILACLSGVVCEVSGDNSGYFEFEVNDRARGRIIFGGAVGGYARVRLTDRRSYVEFVPSYIVIRPQKW